ncbi:hypothetical protein N7470_004634 [Penicillium chermesinum]|nr:hypothetical protein N7470_004634 [Penicillium chermesinum]
MCLSVGLLFTQANKKRSKKSQPGGNPADGPPAGNPADAPRPAGPPPPRAALPPRLPTKTNR